MNWNKIAGSENRFRGGIEGLLNNVVQSLGGRPDRVEKELNILGFQVTRAQGLDGNLALRVNVKGKTYLIENLNNPTVKLEFYDLKVNKPKTASLRGEWWIVDGSALFADGDTGDIGHEGYVIDHIQRKYAYDEFDKGEWIDWDGFKKQLGIEAYEEQNGMPPNPQYLQKYPKEFENLASKKLREMGMTDEEYRIAENRGDARQYGMEHLGWKRVAGNNVQTQTLTSNDLKNIANGLADAYQDEVEDNTLFNIEVNGNGRFYRDVPYYLISDGAPSQLEQYNTNFQYAKGNNWYKTAKKWQKVDSSAIDSIAYSNGTLTVRFAKDKNTFEYYDVPEKTYRDFLRAPSKGEFLNSVIKPRHDPKRRSHR